ncbi:MAG: hypothetical protein PUE72_05155 [Lachnospiraceae bacterium]|nr:hypothetical protein [Lachnospiraceae bacterium]
MADAGGRQKRRTDKKDGIENPERMRRNDRRKRIDIKTGKSEKSV